MSDEENGFRLEQHVGTIMQAAVLGLLAWSLNTTVAMRTEVGVLQAQVASIQTTINQGTNDRYRGSDAARDFMARDREISRLEDRVTKLEARSKP